MKRSVIVLLALAGCGQIAGITELTSDEVPDAGNPTPVVDAGPDVVAMDVVVDTTPPIDVDADKGFRRVFVTSGAYLIYPDDGPEEADTQCTKAATDLKLNTNGEQWIAWISSGNVRAIDRLPFAGEYRLLDAARTVVVSQRDQLKGGTLLHAIDVNENGLLVEGTNDERRVWTGTAANGNIAADCSGWRPNGAIGQFGRAYLSNDDWTDDGVAACGLALRLYCFEQ